MQEREREDDFVVPPVWPPAPPLRPVRGAWWRTPVPLAGVAVVVVAVGVGAYFAGHATAPSAATASGAAAAAGGGIHVRGTLALPALGFIDTSNSGQGADGDSCQATSGYDDITSGAAVTVGGQTGQTLGVGALSSGGISSGQCVFSFDVSVPAGQSVYTVTISHRGTQTFTAEQVQQPIALSLGQ
jgi:hypothetical protein